jgi:hypothetical protein
LKLRCQHIVTRLADPCVTNARYEVHEGCGLSAHWDFHDGSKLDLLANLGADSLTGLTPPTSQMIYASEDIREDALKQGTLPAWFVAWFLES